MPPQRRSNNNKQIPEGEFQLETTAQSLVSQVESLCRGGSVSLERFEGFRNEAERLFEQGMPPMMEYYLQGDFGDCAEFIIKHKKPWKAVVVADILWRSWKAFMENGVTVDVERLGHTLKKWLNRDQREFSEAREAVMSAKIIGLIMSALSMFPKERPRRLSHTPSLRFEDVAQTYKEKRREMRRLWKNCVEFTKSHGETGAETAPLPRPQPPQKPMNVQRGQREGEQRATETTPQTPPTPPSEQQASSQTPATWPKQLPAQIPMGSIPYSVISPCPVGYWSMPQMSAVQGAGPNGVPPVQLVYQPFFCPRISSSGYCDSACLSIPNAKLTSAFS